MDPRAFVEALVAVGATPVISIAMALAVVGGIILLTRRFIRR